MTGYEARTISRRRVVAGAAWTVPTLTIASAAPAFAASCAASTFTADLTSAGYNAATGVYTWGTGCCGSSTPITMSLTSAASGATVGSSTFNLTDDQVGGTGQPGIILQAAYPPANWNGYADFTMTFNTTVSDLQFTLTDIDGNQAKDNNERVVLSPGGFSVVSRGSRVSGNGTAANPFTQSGPKPYDDLNNVTSSAGNVTVSFASASSATIRFYLNDADNNHAIYLTEISFSC